MSDYGSRAMEIMRFARDHPRDHSIRREGDYLICDTCEVSKECPPAGPRPLTPMEASLSPFD